MVPLASGAVLTCLLASCAGKPAALRVEVSPGTAVADGHSTVRISIAAEDERTLRADGLQVTASEAGRSQSPSVRPAGDILEVLYAVGINPGRVTIQVSGAHVLPAGAALETTLQTSDSFSDGMPDFARLDTVTARQAFRRWFTMLAERQAVVAPADRAPEINDCAALLRYAYREALRRHDAAWAAAAHVAEPGGDDIGKYEYPRTPLGANIFRVRTGGFRADDLNDGAFAEFADARTLVARNAYLVSRDVRNALPGDLLFFHQPEQRSPFHSMVYVGRSHFGAEQDVLVYHTGEDNGRSGEMRRVTLDELQHHPDRRWRPLPNNPDFAGVFRWNILREAY